MTWKNRITRAGKEDPRKISPNPRNWRKHPKRQATGLLGALEEVGWVQDVIVNERTGHLVDGHLRVELAIQNNEKAVPVKYVDLSEEEEALVLATLDPITAMAEADKDRLKELLATIETESESLQDLLGSIGKDFSIPSDEPEDAGPQIDRASELMKEWGTEPGQLWQLGPHRVLCGDATKKEDMDRLMQGEKAALFATDPPYGVAYGVETGSDDIKYAPIANDENDGERLQAFLETVFKNSLPHLKTNTAWYLWHAQMTQGFFAAAAAAANVIIHRQIIWVKPSIILGHGDYHWKHELCFYGWVKGHRPKWYGDRAQTTVWEVGRENDHIHPTQKPVELFIRPLRFNTKLGEIALDPFLGSGTTLIACENTKRICYGMEIAPEYIAVTLQRYKDTFGKDPELVA